MAGLVTHVHVFDENQNAVVFAPGDDVPEWAAKQMGDHCFEDGKRPAEKPARSTSKSA